MADYVTDVPGHQRAQALMPNAAGAEVPCPQVTKMWTGDLLSPECNSRSKPRLFETRYWPLAQLGLPKVGASVLPPPGGGVPPPTAAVNESSQLSTASAISSRRAAWSPDE
jgi:hypothetical protein